MAPARHPESVKSRTGAATEARPDVAAPGIQNKAMKLKSVFKSGQIYPLSPVLSNFILPAYIRRWRRVQGSLTKRTKCLVQLLIFGGLILRAWRLERGNVGKLSRKLT